jgi:ABC-type transporter Mla subunit MlaD
MLDRIKEQADNDAEASKQLAAKMEDETNQVTACITSAEENDKALYSGFKSSRRKNRKMDEANSLMTAWLVNVKTISKQTPKGSDEASTAWQRAKTNAELDAL